MKTATGSDEMKNDCTKGKDLLVEAALRGTAAGGCEQHLLHCADCAEELAALRARRERLDKLLPLVGQGVELRPGFRERVLAAAASASEAQRGRSWRVWALSGAMAVIVATLIVGLTLQRRAVRTVRGRELAACEEVGN